MLFPPQFIRSSFLKMAFAGAGGGGREAKHKETPEDSIIEMSNILKIKIDVKNPC